jgi:L-malate glycosyltransferase
VSAAEEMGIPTMRLHGWNTLAQTGPGGGLWTRLTNRLVEQYARAYGEPDILHAHGCIWAGYAAMRSGAKRHVPFVVTEHSSWSKLSPPPRGVERMVEVLNVAAAKIAVSHSLRQRLLDCGVESPITVIPNTVDLDFWTPPLLRSQVGGFTFCAIGHLVAIKGFDRLVRAFAAAFADKSEVRLVIGGDGPLAPELKLLARRLTQDGQIKFLGALSREGVRDVMWEADCLVLPSCSETFGVVLVEALGTGIPVISTRSGGPDNIVTPEVGLLVEPGDEKNLAEAMIRLRAGVRYQRSVLRDYAERYSYETVGADLARVYKVILARH